MHNGFYGTGISIIFYLTLALAMPVVHIKRFIKNRSSFRPQFVIRHFLYAITIAGTALMGISYMLNATGLAGRSQWPTVMRISSWSTGGIIIMAIAIPLAVKLWQAVFGTKPAPPASAAYRPLKRPVPKYQVMDGIVARPRWQRLWYQYYIARYFLNRRPQLS